MKTFIDWFARNRARFGMAGLVLWGVLQTNPGYQDWKLQSHRNLFINDALVALVAWTGGAGKHKSDKYQRDKQELEKE